MEKEYVFHGSPIRVDKLIPNQACDIEYKEGCQYAVYATKNKIMVDYSESFRYNYGICLRKRGISYDI